MINKKLVFRWLKIIGSIFVVYIVVINIISTLDTFTFYHEQIEQGKENAKSQSVTKSYQKTTVKQESERLTVQNNQIALHLINIGKNLVIDADIDADKLDAKVEEFLKQGNKDDYVVISFGSEVEWATGEHMMALTKKHGFKYGLATTKRKP